MVATIALGRKLKPVLPLPAPTPASAPHWAEAAEYCALIKKLQILVVQVLARQCDSVAAQIGMMRPDSGERCDDEKKE